MEVGVEDLDIRRGANVAGGRVARAADVEPQRHRLVGGHPQDEVLQVEDDVGDILLHALQGGELVERLVEPNLGDGGAGDRRQQRAAQRVAERVAEAGLEGLDGEPLAVALGLAHGFDGRSLNDQHCDATFGLDGATSSRARR